MNDTNPIAVEADSYRITPRKVILHLKTIFKHKYYISYYMIRCGKEFIWRSIVHDMSKFSFTEFFTNVKYVKPGVSPIDVQKKEFGYSPAWLHHKGHNPHHYEYWMDRFDDGCYVTRMPYKYSVEMICDYLAANKAYNGKNATFTGQYEWWKNQRDVRNMHPDNTLFVDKILKSLKECEENKISINTVLNSSNLRETYDSIFLKSKYSRQIKIKH